MLIKTLPEWHIPEREAAPEGVYLSRRKFLGAAAIGGAALLAGCDGAAPPRPPDPSAGLYPVARNPAYTLDRPITAESITSRYNNFYEFGSSKQIANSAAYLKTRPWEITIDGEVEKPVTIAIDDLLKKMPLEERLYRLRCVETWAIAVPWTGFALRHLLALAQPKLGTRYVMLTSFQDSSVASGQLQFWYPWPYKEALSVPEAQNELAFLACGVYGKPLAPQFGAPLRLAVPWKYGFKSIKSITRITFTSQRPLSFWEQAGGGEYGFWANVNPEVAHPRWSQAKERVLGENFLRPTQLFNGYGAQVASLYAGMEGQQLWR
jgi:methionine sulfoxide reductase catalytic subunit